MSRFNRKGAISSKNLEEEERLFDESEDDDDDIDLLSVNPLRVRQRHSAGKNKSYGNDIHELKNLKLDHNRPRDLISEPVIEYTEYEILPGDSLQSICLRYACPINLVKRLNNLMNDQEFYGLRQIKLPLGRLGLLEDILKSKDSNKNDKTILPRAVNSPGSALSVSTGYDSRFKPLLSPGFSSDHIHKLTGQSSTRQSEQSAAGPENGIKAQHNHSHSFSSLRDFGTDDVNIDINASSSNTDHQYFQQSRQPASIISRLDQHKNFIKSELHPNGHMDVDDLIIVGNNNVEKVFKDLDHHVERAKAAAESYDQRAAELVDRIIDSNGGGQSSANYIRPSRVSKIPQLFFGGENFGLNYRKLLVFIFVICLVIPVLLIRSFIPETTDSNPTPINQTAHKVGEHFNHSSAGL